jgi:outer membrane protein assembly factor BamD (BamD/ComL family)
MARIYQYNLNDSEQALTTYKEFVKQYPNSIVRPKVEEEIKILEQG